MDARRREEIVRAVFGAYENHKRELLEALIAPDFTFTSPYDDAIDRATYFERCWPNNKSFASSEVERLVVDSEGGVFVTYKVTTLQGKSFRNTEYMTFAGEQLASVHVYFGESYQDGKFVAQEPPKKS